jgi:hypothetical protein
MMVMGRDVAERNLGADTLNHQSMPNDDQTPATKADLSMLRTELREEMGTLRTELREEMGTLRTELRGEMGTLRTELREEMGTLRNDLIESMRDMQTELLRAFHGWARPMEIRLRSMDDVQQRLGLLEERVSAIERGPHRA